MYKIESISKESKQSAVIKVMTENNRRHVRFELPVNVKLTTSSGTELVLKSQDISDSGVFLCSDSATLPDVGESVVIQLASMVVGDAPRELDAVVVRQTNEGIGIEFSIDEDEE